jgi:hypothetical protein
MKKNEQKVRKIEKTFCKIMVEGKSSIAFVLKALKGVAPNPKCEFCHDPITRNNFGGIINKKFFCPNIICLIKLTESEDFKKMNGETK